MPLPALLLLCVLLAAMVFYVVWRMWKGARNSKLLKERGVATTAEVLKQSIRFIQNDNGVGQQTIHELIIRYTVGGKTYETKVGATEEIYHAHPPHSRVEIVYLPENPKIVEVK